jgi:predicted CXXCH cytochrome family protein
MRSVTASLVLLLTLSAALVSGSTAGAEPGPAARFDWNLEHTCTYCHNPHGGPEDHNLWDDDIEVLCLTCHGPGGISSLKAAKHKSNTCVDCHDNHRNVDNWLGGVNLKMVGPRDPLTGLARIEKSGELRDVVFESLGSQAGQPTLHSFSDDDEDNNGVYDGACEIFHLDSSGSGPPSGNHNYGQTCTVCHLHVEGFAHP